MWTKSQTQDIFTVPIATDTIHRLVTISSSFRDEIMTTFVGGTDDASGYTTTTVTVFCNTYLCTR